MTPVAPAGAQVQQHRFVLPAGQVKGLLIKFQPLNALAAGCIGVAENEHKEEGPVKHGIILQAYTGLCNYWFAVPGWEDIIIF